MRMLVVLAAIGLVACAPPERLAGDFPPIRPIEVQQGQFMGQHVRWGGVIEQTTPRTQETCIEIVSLPLDRRARPRLVDDTFGRFLACVPGFYDPRIYAPDREVTVVGTVQGVERGQVGEQAYDYPRLAAEAVYLWPERPRYDYDGYGVGWYGVYPWYPFWGGYSSDYYPHHHHDDSPRMPGPMVHQSPRR